MLSGLDFIMWGSGSQTFTSSIRIFFFLKNQGIAFTDQLFILPSKGFTAKHSGSRNNTTSYSHYFIKERTFLSPQSRKNINFSLRNRGMGGVEGEGAFGSENVIDSP